MANRHTARWISTFLLLLITAVAGWFAWQSLREPLLPEGFGSGNGRIEATETDIATKLPGRLLEVLAEEGDMVAAGQVLGRMDTKSLQAQLREAEARVEQARREHEQAAALVRQRKSECTLAQNSGVHAAFTRRTVLLFRRISWIGIRQQQRWQRLYVQQPRPSLPKRRQ